MADVQNAMQIGDHETWLHLIPGVRELDHFLVEHLTIDGHGWIFEAEMHRMPHVTGLILVAILLIVIGVMYKKRASGEAGIVPARSFGVRGFVDGVLDFARNEMTQVMGEEAARRFLPFIGSFALIILFSNLLGLIPGFLPPTESLNTTLACAILVFLATHYYGLKVNGIEHIKHMGGPVLALFPLIFIIELIGHVARPASLSLRLGGNMIGDHMAVVNFLDLTKLIVPAAIMGLGLIVCIVQTLVFCLLSTVYIGMAIEKIDHHH